MTLFSTGSQRVEKALSGFVKVRTDLTAAISLLNEEETACNRDIDNAIQRRTQAQIDKGRANQVLVAIRQLIGE